MGGHMGEIRIHGGLPGGGDPGTAAKQTQVLAKRGKARGTAKQRLGKGSAGPGTEHGFKEGQQEMRP